MKKKWKLFLKVMIAMIVTLTSAFGGITIANAYQLEDVDDYPKNESITYNGKATYGGSTVGDFTLGGQTAFCMQHTLSTPPTSTSLTSHLYDNDDVKKVLYYGYDGVEPWSGFTSKQHGIVVTSLALSYYYSGDNTNPSVIKNFISFIEKQDVPSYDIHFSKTNIQAYKSGDIQRTESVTLQSGSDQFSLSMNIPSNVTYVDETHHTSQIGGSVNVKGQTTFHLEAPLNVKLEKWSTGNKISSYSYEALISEPKSTSIQTVGRGIYVMDQSKTTSLTVDWLNLANLKLKKTDVNGTFIDGAIFHLWNDHGYDQNVTVQNGQITIENLMIGNYYLQEKTAPQGYLLDSTIYTITLNSGDVIEKIISNKEPVGKIELTKTINSDITDHQLGDAYLQDIEYGLYAKEIIRNAAQTKIYYQKDQFISKKSTDNHGKITWEDLPLGSYYIKELQTNPSLILDGSSHDVSLTYQNMSSSIVVGRLNVEDKIASQRIQIFKEGTKDGITGLVQGLSGAEFTFVLNSDYEKVGFEKAKVYYVGTTDKNGFLTTSLLPYGEYRVKETKTPVGYYGTSDFIVKVEKDASLYEIGYQIQKVTVNNLPFESLIKIVKLDQETGKVIQKEGATFKIKNLDTNEYVSYIDYSAFPNTKKEEFVTHSDGTMTLNTKLKVGHYQLEEMKAPEGYLLSKEPVKFEISEESYELSDDQVTPLTVVMISDQEVKGQVTIEKRGEVLVDFKDGKFVYQMQGLSQVQFEIRAQEDIYTAYDHQIMLYKKGDVVEVLTTDDKGKAVSSKLPLGKYEYQEVTTPLGYVVDKEIYSFSLDYKDQETALIEHTLSVINERQKVDISMIKKDSVTLQPVEGAMIALIANRDIYNYQHELIIKAGTTIETLVSSFEGKVSFDNDLPIDLLKEESPLIREEDVQVIGDVNSLFMMKEIQAPTGYLLKKTNYYIDTSSQQDKTVLSFDFELLNEHVPVETLGDEPPVKTEDTTILLSYLLMGVGAILILHTLLKNKDE